MVAGAGTSVIDRAGGPEGSARPIPSRCYDLLADFRSFNLPA